MKLASSIPCFASITHNRIVATVWVTCHRRIQVIQLDDLGVCKVAAWRSVYAQVHAGVLAARDLLAGHISIKECASRIRAACEFDEVIYNALPADLDELAAMSWAIQGDEYDRNGGDERLIRAARVIAVRDAPH
jgi:hypothetical protein